MKQRTNRELIVGAYYEEYRALYGLVEFRMAALDRRVPVTAAAFAAVVASLASVPAESRLIIYLGLPVALLWFTRAAVNHARSFEDVLRRIEMIEQHVNDLLGEQQVLQFQSHHPSRHKHVGGRTGRESVLAVLVTVEMLLGTMAYQVAGNFSPVSDLQVIYILYCALCGLATVRHVYRLSKYTYIPSV